MKILVIDDQRIFKSFPSIGEITQYDTVVHATTSQEGLEELLRGSWDEVWLDHDLGMESEGSGYDVVMGLLGNEGPLPKVGRVYVHSMNPVGSARMVAALSPHYPVARMDPTPHLDFETMASNRDPFL